MTTRKTYRIRYRDERADDSPVFSTRVTAYDREEAEIAFDRAPGNDGWQIVAVECVAVEGGAR